MDKEQIRNRYKGIDPSELDVIPAIPQATLYEDTHEKRVAVYARVSTDDPRQTSSYELQKNHYMDVVKKNAGWKLVDIYADEGISGTSLKNRDAFVKMIADCKAGKIDLIITKSVARFARNVVDCIGHVRELKQLQPSVGIFFETENIYTLNSNSEMSLSFIATLAQEESRNKSEIMNSSIEMRFSRGIFLTPLLFGYDTDDDGNLIINDEEAKIVQLIFFMYLWGYSSNQIAQSLTNLGCKTKKGNDKWSPSTVLSILQNERHCGDVLARKTWTPDYLDHKPKRNRQDRNQYLQRNHHEPIVQRDDFIAVQRLISNAKYRNKGFLPELNVIQDGVLKGFVSINPRWATFKTEDYKAASDSVYVADKKNCAEIAVQSGDFDLRKFEVVRSQFFDSVRKTCVTFSLDSILFSSDCIRKFDKTLYVEMLVNPNENLFAVRPCTKEMRNAVQWAKVSGGVYYQRNISCAAYIDTLYKLFGWNTEYKYRIRGVRRQKNDESLVIFNINETEVFISQDKIAAYPCDWANNFGNNYYCQTQAKELAILDKEGEWKVQEEGKPYVQPDLQITSPGELQNSIQEIMGSIKQEGA
jgi:DNA invertase Pin-like site-specific DNA recombinase